jgi:hypothetical protein
MRNEAGALSRSATKSGVLENEIRREKSKKIKRTTALAARIRILLNVKVFKRTSRWQLCRICKN